MKIHVSRPHIGIHYNVIIYAKQDRKKGIKIRRQHDGTLVLIIGHWCDKKDFIHR